MKKLIYFLLAALFASACMEEIANITNSCIDDTVFYASIESPAMPASKVYTDENLKVLWNAEDQISVFNKYTYNDQFIFMGNDGDNAGGFRRVNPKEEFITGNELDYIYAVYPYDSNISISNSGVISMSMPHQQEYRKDSFGPNANTMVSVTEDNSLLFRNLSGYMVFKLYGKNVAISGIRLEGNNKEKLAGDASVIMDLNGTPSVSISDSGSEAIELICNPAVVIGNTAEDCTEFWFALPPTEFTNGLTISVYDDKGHMFSKSTNRSLSIQRNTLSSMEAFEVKIELSEEDLMTYPANVEDLGLSVKWATWNIGATKVDDYGMLYGMGDATGMEKSTSSSKYYYGLSSICATEYDLAQIKWGKGWRLPTKQEIDELTSQCTWKDYEINGVYGALATGPNGNTLFFPYSGNRQGKNIYERGAEGHYWSGDQHKRVHSYGYYDVDIKQGKPHQFDGCSNWIGQSIRPVYDESLLETGKETEIEITTNNAGDVEKLLSSYDCAKITGLTINGHIDARDFNFIKWNCTSLEDIDISGCTIDEYTGDKGTNEGYNYTYAANEIPLGAFFYWISSIINGETITNPDGFSDEGMKTLKSVKLPPTIKAIRRNAFARAYNLTSINFPEGLEVLDYVSFRFCVSLEEIELPSTLKDIDLWALSGMNALTTVRCKAATPPSLYDSFDWLTDWSVVRGNLDISKFNTSPEATLYVPKGSRNAYINSEWGDFFTNIIEE
jgi:hypothetical protein